MSIKDEKHERIETIGADFRVGDIEMGHVRVQGNIYFKEVLYGSFLQDMQTYRTEIEYKDGNRSFIEAARKFDPIAPHGFLYPKGDEELIAQFVMELVYRAQRLDAVKDLQMQQKNGEPERVPFLIISNCFDPQQEEHTALALGEDTLGDHIARGNFGKPTLAYRLDPMTGACIERVY